VIITQNTYAEPPCQGASKREAANLLWRSCLRNLAPNTKALPRNETKRDTGEKYLYLPVEIALGSMDARLRGVHARLCSQEKYTKIIRLIPNSQQLFDKKLTINSTDSIDQR
jgi:hypothetical protein